MATISIIRGDTYNLPVTFRNKDLTPVILTSCTVFFTVKPKANSNPTDDTDALISKKITQHTTPTEGKTMLILSSADTNIPYGEYVFDFQIKTQGGDIHSTSKGIFIVSNDVTKETT